MSLVKNYFIQENEAVNTSDVIAQIAIFYATHYLNHVYVIRRSKLDRVPELYKTTDRRILKKIIFLYPKNYPTLLQKLLEISTWEQKNFIPKVLIIESLDNWLPDNYSVNLALDLSPIIASLQNTANYCAKILKETCYSFVTSRINSIPNVILDLYYYKYPLIDIAEKDRIKSLQETPTGDSQN